MEMYCDNINLLSKHFNEMCNSEIQVYWIVLDNFKQPNIHSDLNSSLLYNDFKQIIQELILHKLTALNGVSHNNIKILTNST